MNSERICAGGGSISTNSVIQCPLIEWVAPVHLPTMQARKDRSKYSRILRVCSVRVYIPPTGSFDLHSSTVSSSLLSSLTTAAAFSNSLSIAGENRLELEIAVEALARSAAMAFASTSGTGATSRVWASVLVCSMMLLVGVVQAGDPDALQDFCVADLKSDLIVNGFPCKPRSSVTAKDFVYTGFRKAASDPAKSPTGAIAALATAAVWPGSNTHGVSHGRLDFDVGGVIPFHTHPRAVETLFVLEGSVFTGFVSDDNVLYASTLEKGDFTVFPRAQVHFQINVGKGRAATFNSLTSQNPGFLRSVNQIFEANITDVVIQKAFGIDEATVKLLRASYPH